MPFLYKNLYILILVNCNIENKIRIILSLIYVRIIIIIVIYRTYIYSSINKISYMCNPISVCIMEVYLNYLNITYMS